MTRAHWFVLCYAGFVLLWAIPTLYASMTRLSQNETLSVIRTDASEAESSLLEAAASSLHAALALAPCNMALHRDLQLVLGAIADRSATDDDVAAVDRSLDDVQHAIGEQLGCKPLDGKAWLDYALVSLEREGFGKRSRAAFSMSARVSPRESWLAQRRVETAVRLAPMLDDKTRSIVLNDIAVLDQANHYRLNTVMKNAAVSSTEALKLLFTNTMPSEKEP